MGVGADRFAKARVGENSCTVSTPVKKSLSQIILLIYSLKKNSKELFNWE